MKSQLPGILVYAICALAVFSATAEPVSVDLGPLEWKVPKERVSRNGDILVAELPAGAERDNGRATAVLPIHLFEGLGNNCLRFTVHAKGTGLGKPLKSYQGLKFMVRLDGADGQKSWINTHHRMGDWEEDISFTCSVAGKVPVKAVLYLGIEECAGRVEFDLSTLRVEDVGEIQPPVNQDYKVSYPERFRERGPGRGVMLPIDLEKITEDDFATLESWGANLARYQISRDWRKPFGWESNDDYDAYLDRALEILEKRVLPWAERHGVRIVVDLHATPGARNGTLENRIFTEKRYADHFVVVWERIARRFKGDGRIYGYDLVNEPVQQEPSPHSYLQVQEAAAKAIRAIDPDVTVIVAANGFGHPSGFRTLSPLAMDNIVYTAHCYVPMAFTHQGIHDKKRTGLAHWPDPEKGWDKEFIRRQLAPVLKFAREHDARIFIGEFSAITWAPGAENYIRDCIDIFEEYGWDWCYHAFREWDGWSVEKTWREYDPVKMRDLYDPSEDNPRKRALLDGFRRERNVHK